MYSHWANKSQNGNIAITTTATTCPKHGLILHDRLSDSSQIERKMGEAHAFEGLKMVKEIPLRQSHTHTHTLKKTYLCDVDTIDK